MGYELEMVEVTDIQPAKVYHLYLPRYHYMKQHFHSNIELVYVIKGGFIAHVNGMDTEVHEDSLFLVNANEIHYFEMLEDSEMITVLLSYDVLRGYEERIDDIEFDLSLDSHHQLLKEKIMIMDRYRKGHEMYKEIKVQEYLCSIYYMLLRYFQKPKSNHDCMNMSFQQMQDILEYIECHYNQDISLQQISQYFHYSSSYFCRYFKRMTGKSLYQYIKMIRLNHAFLDVCNSSLEISQIAYEHGFASPKAFIKAFKDKYHLTPGAYRQTLGQ